MTDPGSRHGPAGDPDEVRVAVPAPAESPASAESRASADSPVSAESPAPPAAVEDTADADLILAAVRSVADIAGVSPATFGEIASYLPGRSVAGVRAEDDRVEVHIVARYGRPLQEIADELEQAVRPLLAGRPLQVSVDDILLPGEELADAVPISSRTDG